MCENVFSVLLCSRQSYSDDNDNKDDNNNNNIL